MKKILLIFILLIFILMYGKSFLESISQKNAFCLLMRKPDPIWLDFINTFTNEYDVFVVIDENIPILYNYPNITFLQYDDQFVIEKGYYNSSYVLPKKTISWDKALYYFCEVNLNYKHVWFCEDDVYVPDVETMTSIDKKYNGDLLCQLFGTNDTGDTGDISGWSHWKEARKVLNLPYANCLVCMCRMSNKLLLEIHQFVQKHNKLEFIEFLFATLAYQNNLNIQTPGEYSHITCCEQNNNLDPYKIHHPLKNLKEHENLHNYLKNNYS